MMQDSPILTICLVSRGRDKYLGECLASLEQFSDDPDVRFLIINNGAGLYSSNLLKAFVSRDLTKRELIVKIANDPRPSAYWVELQRRNIEWALFPSDDDILLPSAVETWRMVLKSDPSTLALGASVNVIDANSNVSGVKLEPTIKDSTDLVQNFAYCFHQPPFIWPALFIYVPAVPDELCHSRYAFDWWISLNILATEHVNISKEIILKYRIHKEQESSVAPRRRKYFEASLWLTRFVSSEVFDNWIRNRSDLEILEFWQSLTSYPPVYGFEEFGKIVLFNIAERLIGVTNDREIAGIILLDLSKQFSIFLKNNEGWHISNAVEEMTWKSNIKLKVQNDVCREVFAASLEFTSNSEESNFLIGCLHSSTQKSNATISCDSFFQSDPKLNADLIIMQLTEFYEQSGKMDFALSPGEKLMIASYRKYYSKIPNLIINFAKRSKMK